MKKFSDNAKLIKAQDTLPVTNYEEEQQQNKTTASAAAATWQQQQQQQKTTHSTASVKTLNIFYVNDQI